MTDFPDKPKRKRTPNRRRKFLLMIALPILALIAGFMALKPQMDAWLATDPFTPPCEKVENFSFLVYGETYATDVESSFVEPFYLAPDENYEYHFWFDEQRYLIYMTDGGLSAPGYTSTSIIDMQSDPYPSGTFIPDSIRYNVFARSHQFLAKGSTFTGKVDVIDVFNQELLFREPLPFDAYKGFLFSPNEAYVLIYGDDNSPSYIFNLVSHELQTLPDIVVMGWFDDVHLFYQTSEQAIYTHNVVTDEQTQFEFEQFDSDATTENTSRQFYVMSDNGRWIVLQDNQARVWIWDTQEQTHRVLDSITTRPLSSLKIRGDYLIYNFEDAEAIYWFYSFFEDDYQSVHPYAYPIYISPSGHHVLEKVLRANTEYHLLQSPAQSEEYIFYDLPELGHQNWISVDGHDYIFYSIPLTSDELGERQYYLIDPSSGNRCKLGIWDSSEDFTVG